MRTEDLANQIKQGIKDFNVQVDKKLQPFNKAYGLHGIDVFENSHLATNQVLVFDNKLFVPNNGTMYSIVFMDGVNEQSVKFAMNLALRKILKEIDKNL